MNDSLSGIALINKPAGMTSYQVVNILKKKLDTKKIGHTGTLDPFAEGLLVILVGSMTRFFDYFRGYQKKYNAEAVFGAETDTEDITGKIIKKTDEIPDVSLIAEHSKKFTGEITQIPPIFSALHVNGKRSYQLAREGVIPELKPRKTFIHSFSVEKYRTGILNFTVSCSSGTYIRSIARDLGRSCGSAAYLKALVRTEIGDFNIKNSINPDDFSLENLLSPFEGINIMGIERVFIIDDFISKINNGQVLSSSYFKSVPQNGFSAVFDSNRNFRALIEKNEDIYSYQFVIPENQYIS